MRGRLGEVRASRMGLGCGYDYIIHTIHIYIYTHIFIYIYIYIIHTYIHTYILPGTWQNRSASPGKTDKSATTLLQLLLLFHYFHFLSYYISFLFTITITICTIGSTWRAATEVYTQRCTMRWERFNTLALRNKVSLFDLCGSPT